MLLLGNVLVFCLLSLKAVSSRASSEDRLYNSLFTKSGYNKVVRPVRSKGDPSPLTVQFGMAIVELLELDGDNGRAAFRVWLRLIWKDYRLKWRPAEYGGIKDIKVPVSHVWVPDITLYNGVSGKMDDTVHVVLSYDGTIVYVPQCIYAITCHHDFRSDSWTCPFKFGSWVYDALSLNIVPYLDKNDIDMADFQNNENWILLDHSGERKTKKYECCEESYPAMEYKVRFRSQIGHPGLLGKRSGNLFDF